MKLSHFSAAPMSRIKPIKPGPRLDGMKPAGFWVSVDDADMNWADWAAGEQFGWDGFKYRTPVTLGDANILHIDTLEKLDAFHAGYRLPLYPGASYRSEVIDWLALAGLYDGIIISPYQWDRRLDGPVWYYGWDCASGCVWNKGVIQLGESEPFDIEAYARRRDAA